ncbi:Replicative DNA helicase [Hahella chejuensis KCTC 2396]|uniref:Replicative DNA helicase n=1 Tax=Hahella chejuensis (strain KCTC 2396) TaxID=349521 RepID=Q2SHV5_HAHCH|nr:DNA helicase [Hahella chejuensis]ABC29769.1 Replicative DNA helicase [Hahella chejuensis KCTC 2396]
MKLTAPVHVLKGKAKALKRSQSLTMTEALDQIARAEGFSSWSLLQPKVKAFTPKTTEELLDYLHPGDLLLIGARPGLGKTTMALQLLLQAIKQGRQCFFFSLEYSKKALIEKLTALDQQFELNQPLLALDISDEISADYIINQTKERVTEGSLIAVDYLQLLDQNRNKPPLQQQIEDLKSYARAKKCILVFISQIDRRFDEGERAIPTIKDVRLPNPLDMNLFNKSVFVKSGQIYI